MYYKYWGLNRPPFDNVPDPSMYFRAHQTVEQSVAEVLFAIEEGDECLAVIVGEVGLGKTTCLRVILDSLETEKYRIAFVTNPDVTFTMLLREMIGQLKGEPCMIRRKDELLEEFNRLLFETADQQKRVLIFIDEGNAFKPVNLESLRLLTNMQEDDRNLFTIVLAGQPKLAKMLEAPARANLFQRIGVYCHLEKMESWLVVRDYIDHRMEKAGRTEPAFTDDAVKALYEYSEGGVPRLVNKIAKLALKAGQTNGQATVGADVITAIGERFRRFTRKTAVSDDRKERPADQKTGDADAAKAVGEPSRQAEPLEWAPQDRSIEGGVWPASRMHSPIEEGETAGEADGGGYYYEPAGETAATSARFHTDQAKPGGEGDGGEEGVSLSAVQVCLDDVLRPDIVDKARGADDKERMKLAGQLAAEGIKRHPEYVSENSDPVVAWQALRDEILSAFAEK